MMREALVFLTHLQHQQTEDMMIEMLAEQVTLTSVCGLSLDTAFTEP
jgi:hypothetical protein